MAEKKTKESIYSGEPSESARKKVKGEIKSFDGAAEIRMDDWCDEVCLCSERCIVECPCDCEESSIIKHTDPIEQRIDKLEFLVHTRFGDIESMLKHISRKIDELKKA